MAPTRKISGLSAAHSGSRSGRVLPCRTNSSRWAALMANSPSKMTAPRVPPRRARARDKTSRQGVRPSTRSGAGRHRRGRQPAHRSTPSLPTPHRPEPVRTGRRRRLAPTWCRSGAARARPTPPRLRRQCAAMWRRRREWRNSSAPRRVSAPSPIVARGRIVRKQPGGSHGLTIPSYRSAIRAYCPVSQTIGRVTASRVRDTEPSAASTPASAPSAGRSRPARVSADGDGRRSPQPARPPTSPR